MEIIIYNQTASQKNSKQVGRNRYTGKTFVTSSKTVKDWQQEAFKQLKDFEYKFTGRVQIDYMFYVKDNVRRDLDNMITSINDVLQNANCKKELKKGKIKNVKGTGIIEGDNWQKLKIGSADAKIDRERPRAVLKVTPIDPVE